jgi:hypothetical protein
MNLLDPLSGDEPLTRSAVPEHEGFLKDFWGWSFSALHDPLLRGYIAEYMVYRALFKMQPPKFQIPTSHFSTKMEADVHDLVFFMNDEKYTIQVKSKDSYSKSQKFDTSFVEGFDCSTNKALPPNHWSDFYIFAYLSLDTDKCELLKSLHEQWNLNPSLATQLEKNEYKTTQDEVVRSVLEISNWTFYILEREQLHRQKSINLNKLRTKVKKREALEVSYDDIAKILMRLATLRYAKNMMDARGVDQISPSTTPA